MSIARKLVDDDEDWGRLARYIRDRRELLGLSTRRTLAQATGLSYRLLGDLERGTRSVSDGTLSLVEQALDWQTGSAREILHGGEPTPRDQLSKPDPPADTAWMRSMGEAYRIAADLVELGQGGMSSRLTRTLSDISQALKAYSMAPDEQPVRPEGRVVDELTNSPRPTVLGIALGLYMRQIREERGMTSERASAALGWPAKEIWLLEIGYMNLSKSRLRQLLRLYGRDDPDVQKELIKAVEEASQSGWWARYDTVLPDWLNGYLYLEECAHSIRTFEASYVPGLLQTTDYARSIISFPHGGPSTPEIEQRITKQLDLRMKRQLVLNRPCAPHLWAIIGEDAIDNALAAPDVILDQIVHLIQMSKRNNVVIQVLPRRFSVLAGFAPSFSLLKFQEARIPDIVYTEQFTSALYLDKVQDVSEYKSIMDLIAVNALNPSDSVRRLKMMQNNLIRAGGTRAQQIWTGLD